MSDFVPSPSGDALLWLHAIELEAERGTRRPPSRVADRRPAGERRDPGRRDGLPGLRQPAGPRPAHGRPDRGPGRSPARGRPRNDHPDAALGRGGRRRERAGGSSVGAGRGRPARTTAARPSVVDLSIARDAVISLDDWDVPATELLAGGPRRDPAGTRSIEVLPAARIPVEVQVVDRTAGEPVPSRVRFTAADGRYLPPVGHRDEINPAFFEDTGGDLILGSAAYAYVPGRFTIELPARRGRCRGRRRVRPGADEDAARGGPLDAPPRAHARPDDRPPRRAMGHRRHARPLPRPLDGPPAGRRRGRRRRQPAGRPVGRPVHEHDRPAVGLDGRSRRAGGSSWSGPRTARTSSATWRSSVPTGRSIPFASGGPPEGRLAGALDVLLADWADRCRAAGGLVVAAHFPLPYAEIAADIVAGKIDALETQALAPGLDDPAVARVVPLPRPGLPAADRGRARTRCRPRSRSGRSGPTSTCCPTTRSASTRGRPPSAPDGHS